MAVDVASSRSTKSPEAMSLAVSSIIGAVLVLAAAALVLRGVPVIWEGIANSLGIHDPIVRLSVQVVAQLTAALGLVFLASKIGVGQIASGLRGGIFLMIAVAFVGFFALKGLYTAIGEGSFTFAHIVVMLFYVVIVFLLVQMFRTGRFTQWSVQLDKAGWFDTHTHKRTQGLKVRRLTILGILLVAGSGIYTMINHNYLPRNAEVTLPDGQKVSNRLGDWVVGGEHLDPLDTPKAAKADASDAEKAAAEAEREHVRLENRARPRHEGGVTLLPDLQFTIPLILIAATLWFAWRTVNYPVFADFLIATEAEINKVSWTSRRALFRDAMVVLVSLVLVTIFLFFVDVFWGWLLSREVVGVLPTAAEREAAKSANVSPAPVKDW